MERFLLIRHKRLANEYRYQKSSIFTAPLFLVAGATANSQQPRQLYNIYANSPGRQRDVLKDN